MFLLSTNDRRQDSLEGLSLFTDETDAESVEYEPQIRSVLTIGVVAITWS